MNPLLIGLSGKAGAGKTTLANHLTSEYGYHQFAFADALKDVVGRAFGFSDEQLYGDQKEIPDPRFGKSPRWCLQYLGTEVFRSIWPEIWIWNLRQSIMDFLSTNGQRLIVVTDVRFRDEAEALRRLGAALIRIERPGALATEGVPDHVSETDLDTWPLWDQVIFNEGSIEELFGLADLVLFNRMEAAG